MSQEQLIERPQRGGIASLALDVPLAHVDRFFDYSVPAELEHLARVGVRVKARFAGRKVDGFIVARPDSTDFDGQLLPIDQVVSPEVVITAEQIALVRATADHYAGTFADVMRLAVPTRHAATENAPQPIWPQPEPSAMPQGALFDTSQGEGFLAAVQRGEPARALWQVPAAASPAADVAAGICQAVMAALSAGRTALVVVPEVKELTRVQAALEAVLGKRTIAVLHSDLGPSARYRNYLAVLRGQARVVMGTRAAVFAPLPQLGLTVLVDDGDDLYAEPRAPYPHARQVAAMRVPIAGSGLLVMSRARSCEVQAWLEAGWLHSLEVPRDQWRRLTPLIKVSADSERALARDPRAAQIRLPQVVFETIRLGLSQGPVLVQVPRGGHLLALCCQRCREPARCGHCHGGLQAHRSGGEREPGQLSCPWCARPQGVWRCPVCQSSQVRSPVVGASQTAADFARAFPGVAVLDSSRDHVIAEVSDEPAIVVSTPGAEPVASHGYAAAVLLDTSQLLARSDLRASEEAFRRWQNAIGLVRSGAEGGTVCVVGQAQDMAIQALVRQDPAGFAARLLAERGEAGFPPAVKLITIDGLPQAVTEVLEWGQVAELDHVEVLGPAPVHSKVAGESEGLVRVTLRSPRQLGSTLVRAVEASLQQRAARKATPVRVRVDPAELR